MRPWHSSTLAVGLAAHLLLGAAWADPPSYQLVDLGFFRPADINRRGHIAGTYSPSNGVQLDSFPAVWRDGQLIRIPLKSRFLVGYATAINRTGHVVGYVLRSPGGFWDRRGFFWDGVRVVEIGTFGGRRGEAAGLNDFDEVTGSATDVGTAAYSLHGFLWRQGTLSEVIPIAHGGSSTAVAINNFGEVVGNRDSGVQDGYIWRDGNYSLLASFGGSTTVNALNDHTQVVGAAGVGSGAQHAFIWESGVMRDLGTLPGGDFSVAYGINNAGDVVGSSQTDQCDPDIWSTCVRINHAVIWRDGVMVDLNEEPVSGLDDGPWVLKKATGINERGDIVGEGSRAGQRRYFLLRR